MASPTYISGMTDITDAASTKYGYTETLGESGDTFAEDDVLTMTAYMPEEASSPADDEETTTTGDRINKGESVSVWSAFAAGATTVDAECTAAAVIVLGAATLAAGSLAAAAALAF